MPPIDPLAPAERPFHVHLTGFGPFAHHTTNASWETVRPLNGTVLAAPPSFTSAENVTPSDDRSSRPIHLTSSLLPVKYTSALSLVPALHQHLSTTDAPRSDLIVHCGVSGQDRAIRLEQRARKWGYKNADVDGELAPGAADGRRGFVGKRWRECPEELRTKIDVERVCEWAKRRGVERLSPSEDAGLYLCEFSFYTSLASAWLQDPVNPTPVVFVHVPPSRR
ncbi:hypothetical protein JCM10449v2_005308 [Rhodotorula kratochvilovae]